jgi:hypothetical protein
MIFLNKKILFVFPLLIINVLSQSTKQQQYEYANNLFAQEKYFDAITELKRLQFFDKQNAFSFQTNLLIGKCYKAGAKFDDAIKYFTLAEINAKNDSKYFEAQILNIRTNILRRTNKQAERMLNKLLADTRFIFKEKEIKYWIGWNLMFTNQWQSAYLIFKEEDLDTTLANLCKSVDETLYSENFAKYSSYIIPGLGQIYTGDLTINSFIEDRALDGLIIGNLLWLRFYSGNIKNAEKFAAQKNLQLSNDAMEYLQKNFYGERP